MYEQYVVETVSVVRALRAERPSRLVRVHVRVSGVVVYAVYSLLRACAPHVRVCVEHEPYLIYLNADGV